MKDIKCVGFRRSELKYVEDLVQDWVAFKRPLVPVMDRGTHKTFSVVETKTQIVLRKV